MPGACKFIKKETLAQVFPCEFCEISKNTFFYRTPPVADSVLSIIKNKKKLYILNFAAGLAKTPNLVDVSETVKS